MLWRLKGLDETKYNLRNHVKRCTIFWINVLKFTKCDLRIDEIENVVIRLMCDIIYDLNMYTLHVRSKHNAPNTRTILSLVYFLPSTKWYKTKCLERGIWMVELCYTLILIFIKVTVIPWIRKCVNDGSASTNFCYTFFSF